uniref:Uncharacterized protein n=1 Tax=Plectus sambesii TaxID=2011161 RepID=A0A914VHD0_9BILA
MSSCPYLTRQSPTSLHTLDMLDSFLVRVWWRKSSCERAKQQGATDTGVDVAMAVNTALFEQTGNRGYTMKPRVLWDHTHPMYRRFNPSLKDFPGHSGVVLNFTVVSGQHLCPGLHSASPYIEVEIIGIMADCAKEKTKTVQRNAVNPIWQQNFSFRVNFLEFAFLRVAVCDSSSNGKCVAQRVIPLKCLRPGFRHVRLRTPANLPLDQSTLFIRSRFEEEEHIYLHDEDSYMQSASEQSIAFELAKKQYDESGIIGKQLPMLKRQIFVLRISGLYADDTATVVQAESSSTVRSVIQSALLTCGKNVDNAEDYLLIEESLNMPATGEDGASGDGAPVTNQRILPPNEQIMDAVACWNGSTRRFVIRKKGSDPSSRAWITSIIKSGGSNPSSSNLSQSPSTITTANLERQRAGTTGGEQPVLTTKSHSSTHIHGRSLDADSSELLDTPGMHPRARSMGETFLVCIHNVSEDQPYAILRASVNSDATAIIKQVFLKARRLDADENDFVIVEELPDEAEGDSSSKTKSSQPGGAAGLAAVGQAAMTTASAGGNGKNLPTPKRRVLAADENVWKAQSRWKTAGRFLLENRRETVHSTLEKCVQRSLPGDQRTTSPGRKISLASVRSINFRIPRFGKSLTLDNSAGK